MKLSQILEVAGATYPRILEAWDAAAERPTAPPTGDPLAWFVVSEIHSTYDPSASDKAQLAMASNAISRAKRELRQVETALSCAYVDVALDDWARREERGAA